MQHLPFLKQKAVPYLGGPPYRGEGLETFLKRHGWSDSTLSCDMRIDESPEARIAFLQSLLNIAILIEFLKVRDVSAVHEDFCQDGTTIDTSALFGLIDDMARNEIGLSPIAKEQQTRQVHSIFKLAWSCTPPEFMLRQGYTALAVSFMGSTLRQLSERLNFISSSDDIPDKSVPNRIFQVELLSQAKWCPRHLAELYSSSDEIYLYYVEALSRNPRVGNHGLCTASKCASSQIDSKNYQTVHTDACGGRCVSLLVDQEELSGYLCQDIVPLLNVKFPAGLPTDKSPEICIAGSGPYIAISHVWAHGRMIESTL